MTPTFKDRLKQLREARGLNQVDLGKIIDKSKSTISMYENGRRTPTFETQEALADFFNVDLDYLRGRSDIPSKHPIDPAEDEPWKSFLIPIEKQNIPIIGTMACGEPVFRENDFPAYVIVGTEIKADAAVVAQGDSMINARINDGDIVFIRYQPSVENGEIAAVWVDGDDVPGYQIKRFYRYDNMIILRSDSPDREEWVYKEEDAANIRVIGKAIAFQSDVK